MDLERLPSGKFAANSLILTLSVTVFNMLRLCGQEGTGNGYTTGKKVKRRRLRTVIQDLMYMAARVVTHAHQMYLSFLKRNKLREVWTQIYLSFCGVT